MEDAVARGAVSGLIKPVLNTFLYWIQLVRGKHTTTEDIKKEAAILEGAIWDTYNWNGIRLRRVREAKGQAEDLHDRISAILDDAQRLSRYDHSSNPLRFILRYGHNIWHTRSLWKTANKIVKLRGQITPLLNELRIAMTIDGGPAARDGILGNNVASVHHKADFVGMARPLKYLFKYLMNGVNRREVVIVVGENGAGKSTLVRHVYEDIRVKEHFNCHAWVPIDASFNAKDILRCIIRRLYEEANKSTTALDELDVDMLGSRIRRFLEKAHQRYVIVLDDISTRPQLQTILDLAIPDENCNNFGRIIVTSRNVDVAEACTHAHKIDVEQLSETEVWELFCKKASPSMDIPLVTRRRIITLCAGLPLATVLLGGLLSKIACNQWNLVISELQQHGYQIMLGESINDVSAMPQIDINVERCLMYFSIFPKGSEITHNTLVRLWIAEGFIHVRGGMTQEATATSYLSALIERNIVQVAEHYHNGMPKSYNLNGPIHDEIKRMAEEVNFCATLQTLSNSPDKIRGLSGQVTVRELPENVRLPNLLSLFISDRTSHVCKLLHNAKSLKVLSLTEESVQAFPKEISKLTHLRYLNLGNNTRISKLPKSIGVLINLQSLILKGTLVSRLPKAISKLRQLQHLVAYRYDVEKRPDRKPYIIHGVEVQNGIGKLKELKTLSVINVDKDRSTIKELQKLTNLKRLGIVNLKGNDGPDLCTAVAGMNQLSSISLGSSDNEPINLQNLTLPNLERLYLRGRLNVSQNFFPSLESLVRLRLIGSGLESNSFHQLQQLPNLAELALIQALETEEINLLQDGFPNLKILDLDQLNNLVNMTVHGSLKNLCKLIIRNCNRLESVPLGIECLKKLKELHLFDMPECFLQKLEKGNEHYKSIQHIGVIRYYREGCPQVRTNSNTDSTR
ncbi:disease resistance protein RPM1-like [Oryza brachyantha]|nr:disease resistance protein RPM1-like [Oryza brachyantha]